MSATSGVQEAEKGHGTASFKQQNLTAYQPVLTPVSVIIMLLCIFVVFLPIGIVLEDSSNQVISQSLRYDNKPECAITDDMDYTQLPRECSFNITIAHDMETPIYFYYELRNFYQNHRKYVASKSSLQLRGEGNAEVNDFCSPLKTHSRKTLLACGLIAGSFFEDRFSASVYRDGVLLNELCPSCINYGPNNVSAWHSNWHTWHDPGTWQMEGIAWSSDLDEKYIYVAPTDKETQVGVRQQISGLRLPDIDNEDFVVWMRTAAMPNFRKLHRINKKQSLKANDVITVTILNWFPVTESKAEKWIAFSTAEWCGVESHSLAWTYIVVACVAIGLTVTFAILLLFGKRKMADVDQFLWHNRPNNQALVSIA